MRIIKLMTLTMAMVITSPAAFAATFHPGPSVALGARTKTTRCKVVQGLPDRRCSPGARFKNATKNMICTSGYTAVVRNVPESVKDKVFAEYGVKHHSGKTFEVDHIVPLELGGSNSILNLFPEPAPGFRKKDRLENRAHNLVCDGKLALRSTQKAMARNWRTLYPKVFAGSPG